MNGGRQILTRCLVALAIAVWMAPPATAGERASRLIEQIGVDHGICVVLGDPTGELALELANGSELTVYLQLTRAENVAIASRALDRAGFYGTRIYVEKGDLRRLHLADNLADAVIAMGEAATEVPEAEVLRVLCPRGKALLDGKELVKPLPDGADDWSHPYHGPDNNPQSKDQLARAPYLTQFLAEPRFGPSPQVTVASAGRVFKAFGNVAWHKREESYLNTLVAFNGHNGTILWKRELAPGYMVHRNTMIATPDVLYLGDDKSCKMIDAGTGKLAGEIVPPVDVAGGTYWKWMAMEDGVLYALVGEHEQDDPVNRWNRKAHGWPWDGISKGYNQPTQPWGFGRTMLAIDPKTKEVLWDHHEDDPIDGRAVCMKNGRIFMFGFGKFLTSLDASDGKVRWKKTRENAPGLFDSLGKYLTRQSWQTNWRTAAYLKCSDKALYFAGPQVGKLLAVSAEDGRVLWENPYNNFQLILRDDGLYGISGPWGHNVSKKLDPLTGEVLAELSTGRRGCTRPTGSIDAIFHRAMGGSVRFDVASNCQRWVSPMRPSCHDGVTIANGLLYWWPWTCDCQLTLYGVTCLGPAGDFNFRPTIAETERLERGPGGLRKVAKLAESPADWPTFRADNQATAVSRASIPDNVSPSWQFKSKAATAPIPTALTTVGGLAFVGSSDGIVRAIDTATGRVKWTAYTGGAVRLPPTVAESRVFVGSGDGWMYALEARTGELIWRFRAAPEHRKIPVYGSLLSTWPAASGVRVENGIAYVAAGIVNYDGTYVYALDAATGELKWVNDTSGHLDADAQTGVSVQGHLLLHGDKLYLAGGNAVSPAVYSIADGRCHNDPAPLKQCASASPRGWELSLIGDRVVAFGSPFYTDRANPVYDRTVASRMFHASAGDRDIVWLNNKKILCLPRLDKKVLDKCVAEPKPDPRHVIPTWGKFEVADKPLWEHDCPDSVAMAVCGNAVVVASTSEVVALSLADGKPLWTQPLPAAPVSWGLAVDRDGRVMVSLEDGRVLCFKGGV